MILFGSKTPEEKAIDKGLEYQNSDNYEKAEAEFKKILEFNPNSTDAYYYLGGIYKIQGKNDEAIAAYQQAMELDPNNGRARYMLKLLVEPDSMGPGAAETNTPAPAKEIETFDYEKLKAELEPEIKKCYESALHAAQESDYPLAIKEWEKTISLNPYNVKARYNLAVSYLRTGHAVKAVGQLREVLKIKPDYQLAQDALAKMEGKE